MHLKRFLISGLLLASLSAAGQDGELPSAEIDVVKNNKRIVLPEIQKPQEKVTLTLRPLPKVKQKYQYREFEMALPLLDPRISPPAVRPAREPEAREGYVRGAIGNLGSTLLDAFYNSGRRKDYAYGVFFRHLASAKGPVSHSGFSSNELGAYGKYFTPSFILAGGLNYNRNRVNFYGYDRDRFTGRGSDSTRQVLNRIDFYIDLEKARDKKKFGYRSTLNIANITDRFRASESEFFFDAAGKYRFRDSSFAEVRSDLSLLKRSDSADLNRTLWRIEPLYHFRLNRFSLFAGFQASAVHEGVLQTNGSLRAEGSFHLHPRVGVEQRMLKGALTAFASFSGGMQNQSLRNQLQINPFLGPDVHLRHLNQLWVFSGGIKGSWNSRLQYRSTISLDKVRNLIFFQNDPLVREHYRIVYDSGSSNRFCWDSEIQFDAGEKTRMGIRYTLTRYTLDTLSEPWHLPGSVVTATVRQYLSDKILLSGEFYYMGGLRGYDFKKAETENLKPLADLNLKGEYFFKNRFSGFISVHNLLNNRNQRFLYYPTQGLRIMVGASATF